MKEKKIDVDEKKNEAAVKPKRKVAIYTRVATREQAEQGFSLEAQLEQIKEYCATNQLEIYKVYTDVGESGRTTKRPKYQQMMKDMKFWDAIIVLKMDRIHRNSGNLFAMVRTLRYEDKHFVAVLNNFSTASPMGHLMLDMIEQILEIEKRPYLSPRDILLLKKERLEKELAELNKLIAKHRRQK